MDRRALSAPPAPNAENDDRECYDKDEHESGNGYRPDFNLPHDNTDRLNAGCFVHARILPVALGAGPPLPEAIKAGILAMIRAAK